MQKLHRRGIVVLASGIRTGQRRVLHSVGALDLLHHWRVAAWGGWCNGQRDLTVVRPARRVWEYGRPVIRVPTPARAVPTTATHHVDEIRAVPATGWTVTVCGPAEAAPAVPRRGQRSRAGDRDWRAYAAPALSEPVRSTSVADASGHR